MKDINNFSRRKFMTGMAKAGAMLPFAGQMLGQNAFAAGAGYKNVLFFYHPNGVQTSSWNPSRTGSIVGVTDELSFGLGPLKAWHNNMIVFKNIFIDIQNPNGGGDGGGHKNSMKGCLTGDQDSSTERASIDVMIANKLNQSVLSVGVRTGNSGLMKASKPQNYGNESRPMPNINPFDVATKLDARVSPTPADPLQTKVYEAALADLTALSSGDLTLERKAKIEQHRAALDAIKNKQQQGTKNVPFDFSQKEVLGDNESIKGKANEAELFAQYPLLCKAQINNVVAAFANGLHRVATLQLGAGDENPIINYSFDECWEMVELAQSRGLGKIDGKRWDGQHTSHTASHHVDWSQSHAQVRWHNSLLAYTLEQLKAKDILKETLVVTISDEGDGADHTLFNGSIVVAGGTEGGLSMGRIIDCGHNNNFGQGQGTHKLFGDIAKLVGAPISEGPWKSGLIT